MRRFTESVIVDFTEDDGLNHLEWNSTFVELCDANISFVEPAAQCPRKSVSTNNRVAAVCKLVWREKSVSIAVLWKTLNLIRSKNYLILAQKVFIKNLIFFLTAVFPLNKFIFAIVNGNAAIGISANGLRTSGFHLCPFADYVLPLFQLEFQLEQLLWSHWSCQPTSGCQLQPSAWGQPASSRV